MTDPRERNAYPLKKQSQGNLTNEKRTGLQRSGILTRFHFTDRWYSWPWYHGMSITSLLVQIPLSIEVAVYNVIACCPGISNGVFRFILYAVWSPHIFPRNR